MDATRRLFLVGAGTAAILVAAVLLAKHHERVTPATAAASPSTSAPPALTGYEAPAPAQGVAANELCTFIADGQASLTQASQQAGTESNPLRQADVQAQYTQRLNDLTTRLQQFIDSHGQLNNYEGTVASISYTNYNLGPGVDLGISLPCGVTVFVRFLDVTNPGWGQFDPTHFSQLSTWRPMLESLNNGDAVTFSVRILPLAAGAPYTFPPPGSTISISGLIVSLSKN